MAWCDHLIEVQLWASHKYNLPFRTRPRRWLRTEKGDGCGSDRRPRTFQAFPLRKIRHHALIAPLFSFLSLLRGNRITCTVHDATIGQWTAQVTVQ